MECKKQHYMPQCYLKGFSNQKGIVWVCDKKLENKIFQKNIDDILWEDNMYTIKDDTVVDDSGNPVPPLYFEKKFFAEDIELRYSKALAEIDKYRESYLGSPEDYPLVPDELLMELSYLISIQFLRMPSEKESTIDIYEGRFFKDVSELFKEGLAIELNNPGIRDLEIIPELKDSAYMHAHHTYNSEELVKGYVNTLYNNIWTFYVSLDNEFCVSDNPFVQIGTLPRERPLYGGFGRKGGITYFPLSSSLYLVISDVNTLRDKMQHKEISKVDKLVVSMLNKYQQEQANRIIISKVNDFDFINLTIGLKRTNDW